MALQACTSLFTLRRIITLATACTSPLCSGCIEKPQFITHLCKVQRPVIASINYYRRIAFHWQAREYVDCPAFYDYAQPHIYHVHTSSLFNTRLRIVWAFSSARHHSAIVSVKSTGLVLFNTTIAASAVRCQIHAGVNHSAFFGKNNMHAWHITGQPSSQVFILHYMKIQKIAVHVATKRYMLHNSKMYTLILTKFGVIELYRYHLLPYQSAGHHDLRWHEIQ